MHQIFDAFFSSRRAFWDEVRSAAVSVYLGQLERMN